MDVAQLERHMQLVTQSVKEQQQANKASLDYQLDAGDRLLMRKAADATIQLAEMPATDPT